MANRKPASGGIPVLVMNGYALSDPILFVSRKADGSELLHARVNARINTGAGDDGVEHSTDAVLDYWAGAAVWACNNISKGSRIIGEGRLQSWSKPTGKILENGKPDYEKSTTVTMRTNYFGGPTQKNITDTIDKGLEIAKNQGLIPQNVTITGNFFMPFFKGTFQEFSWDTINATGKLGHAKVWDKARNGFIVPNGQPTNTTVPNTKNEFDAQEVQRLMKELQDSKTELAKLKGENTHVAEPEIVQEGAAEAAGAAEVDPMEGV